MSDEKVVVREIWEKNKKPFIVMGYYVKCPDAIWIENRSHGVNKKLTDKKFVKSVQLLGPCYAIGTLFSLLSPYSFWPENQFAFFFCFSFILFMISSQKFLCTSGLLFYDVRAIQRSSGNIHII